MVTEWHKEAERALNRRDYRLAHELCLKILAAEPDHADAWFLLGMLAAEHRNFGKALEVIERAIAIAPQKAEYFAHRGRCLIALNRPREAFESAAQALHLEPRDALTLDTIGVVMTRAGAHAEALEPFRRAVARDSRKPAYHYNLAASLQFVGELQAAELEYRETLRLEPRFHRAWSRSRRSLGRPWLGSRSRHSSASSRSRRSTRTPSCMFATRSRSNTRTRDDTKPRFGCSRAASAAKPPRWRYDFGADQALFAAAERLLPALAGRDSEGCASREPIFIVGMPRTGTTLVERILSSHPSVFSAGELTNFGLVLKRATGTPSNHVLDAETLEAGARCDLAALGAAYVESTRPRTGHTPRFIDKMPLNFFYAPLIHRALPHAKIICVRRNPLDTCLSNYRQLFATNFSYYNYAYDLLDTGRYYAAFDSLTAIGARAAEELPRGSVPKMSSTTPSKKRAASSSSASCPGRACLAFQDNTAPVATASSVQVRQPIYRTSVERWRHYERELAPLRALLVDAGVL